MKTYLTWLGVISAFFGIIFLHTLPVLLPLIIIMLHNGSLYFWFLTLLYIPVLALDFTIVQMFLE